MGNRFFVILAIIVLAFVGLFLVSKKDSAKDSGNATTTSNHVQGAGTSGVTLLEYGDFQCPACGSYYPILKQVKAKYGDQITFQFRNFPIVSIHPNAMSAHRAAEAAHKQGKFFEMHDMLYERQQQWTTSQGVSAIFESYATELGLNLEQYKQDLASADIQGIISADIKAGQEANVTATPGFVLDGKKLEDNPRDLDGFSQLIDAAIAAKKQ